MKPKSMLFYLPNRCSCGNYFNISNNNKYINDQIMKEKLIFKEFAHEECGKLTVQYDDYDFIFDVDFYASAKKGDVSHDRDLPNDPDNLEFEISDIFKTEMIDFTSEEIDFYSRVYNFLKNNLNYVNGKVFDLVDFRGYYND